MIPKYPMPTSGVGPSVAGRSTTWITASAVSASAPIARVITSAPWAAAGMIEDEQALMSSAVTAVHAVLVTVCGGNFAFNY